MKERVGFIGLGIKGRGMARNLVRADFPLTVWNRTTSRMQELVTEGAAASSSPADCAVVNNILSIAQQWQITRSIEGAGKS